MFTPKVVDLSYVLLYVHKKMRVAMRVQETFLLWNMPLFCSILKCVKNVEVAIASKPTFSPAERVIRSPFLLTKFILRIVYEVECRAMHIIDDVDEM